MRIVLAQSSQPDKSCPRGSLRTNLLTLHLSLHCTFQERRACTLMHLTRCYKYRWDKQSAPCSPSDTMNQLGIARYTPAYSRLRWKICPLRTRYSSIKMLPTASHSRYRADKGWCLRSAEDSNIRECKAHTMSPRAKSCKSLQRTPYNLRAMSRLY